MILKKEPRNKEIISVAECICHDKTNKLILLRKRNDHKDYPGRWGFPAGRLERKEKPLAGIKREVEEETGFRFNKNKFILLSDSPTFHLHKRSKGYVYVKIFTYIINKKIDLKKIKIDKNEHEGFNSFGIEELKALDRKNLLMPDTLKIYKIFK